MLDFLTKFMNYQCVDIRSHFLDLSQSVWARQFYSPEIQTLAVRPCFLVWGVRTSGSGNARNAKAHVGCLKELCSNFGLKWKAAVPLSEIDVYLSLENANALVFPDPP